MLQAGMATCTINNELGTDIQGAGVNRQVRAVRDDLEANALYLRQGAEALLFVSCDLGGLETDFVRNCTAAMAAKSGVAPEAILIGCSHTHAGPSVLRTSYTKPVDEAYLGRLQGWLCELAAAAVQRAAPARFGWARGRARLGYQRRVCYADGQHTMYRQDGHGLFTGLEGPEDLDHLVLAVFAEDAQVQALLHHGTGHPAALYGADVLSAEYPGRARQLIREALGALPVLFFNGALGDQAGAQQIHPPLQPRRADEVITRLGATLAGETLRALHEMELAPDPLLRHRRAELELPVQLPSPQAVAAGRAVLERIDAGEEIAGMEAIFAFGPVLLQERFGSNPVDRVALHAVRIGELALVTHPFEIYCQYQLDLKRRSPAGSTALFGLTDGYGGYLPTQTAVLGGGYSGTPFAWARFAPAVGCRVVDEAAGLLHALWRDD